MQHRVLIVTDDADDAAALQDALYKANDGPYEVIWVRLLSEAIGRLSSDNIDVVLIDLSLPDNQGIDTFDKVFEATPQIPILTLSAVDDEVLAIEAVQRGAQGYISKGYFSSYLVPQSLRNVIQRKAVEQISYFEKERASIILRSINDSVIGTDMHGKVDFLNTAAERMTGWLQDEAHGHSINEVMPLINAVTRETVHNPLISLLNGNNVVALAPGTTMLRRGGSHEFFIEDSTALIQNRRGNIIGAVMVFRDTTTAQILSQQIVHLAQHDALTNLPNRVLLYDRIEQAILHAKRHGNKFAVLFIDVDKFKNINDSLGHGIGDKLLQLVASRLISCVRASDTVSRLGGDEFVILLSEIDQVEDAAQTAKKIMTELEAPHLVGQHKFFITASIGVSIYPGDGETSEDLLKNADTAMYQAKHQGRNNYQFFTSAMNVRAVERQVVEDNLRTAIERHELILHYQPKVKLDSQLITGAEALVRWMHPTWGMTWPVRFIHIAEDSGLIVPIGRWVMQEACRQVVEWQLAGLNPGTIAVNVSSLEFRNKNFVKGVADILSQSGLAPQTLQLEITESVLMKDVSFSIEVLAKLKAIGVELAVDDFGTGYSSLSYLLNFPIDVLKIDQSFIKDIVTNKNNGFIVGAVIAMGKNLHHRVIAEGVEDDRQVEFLKEQGCEEGQGYYFSRPVNSDKFKQLLISGVTKPK